MKSVAYVLAVAGVVLGGAILLGFHLNTSNSIPEGIYVETGGQVQRGAIVLVCPPGSTAFEEARARGYLTYSMSCPGNFGHMMKRVVGMPGDTVAQSRERIAINDQEMPNSASLSKDRAGRPLGPFTAGEIALGSGQVYLMADTEQSFDSRYFGAVDAKHIVAVIRPVITW